MAFHLNTSHNTSDSYIKGLDSKWSKQFTKIIIICIESYLVC